MPNWIDVPAPVCKVDWRFKHLRLLALPPEQALKSSDGRKNLPIEKGAIVKINMRRHARETWSMCSVPDVSPWGDVRVLELEWHCTFCGSAHRFYIPESWVAEGKAVFVKQEDTKRKPLTAEEGRLMFDAKDRVESENASRAVEQ